MRPWVRSGVFGAALALPLLAGLPTHATEDAPQPASADPSKPATPLDDKQMQLRGLRETIDASEAKRKALDAAINGFKTDHAKLAAALIDTTRKVGEAETSSADARARLDLLTTKEEATRRSLDSRRVVVAEVLAALQRMGRKPPPALLVDPDDVLKAIRTSMLLGAVLPGMRTEIEALVGDLADLSRTRATIAAERKTLDDELLTLGGERQRLAALIAARQASLGKAESDLAAERDTAKQLAAQAGSLKDLIARMERDNAAAEHGAEAARQADATLAAITPDPTLKPNPAPFKDTARLAPAVAFPATKGLLPLPVGGSVLRRFGEDDGLGGNEKGMLFETRASSVVAAPADGWVAYAGPYRSFGQLLILNVGSGYYIVLAGMERINVSLGQFVLAGEPIAAMGDGPTKTAAAVALGAAQPVLYVEFRKDGATFDPGPWWAKPELQKVRG